MKKLMVMAMAIGMAVAAQAALCSWSYYTTDGSAMAGTAYLVLGSSAQTTWDSLAAVQLASVDSAALTGGYGESTGDSASFVKGQVNNAYVVLVNDAEDKYGVTEVKDLKDFVYAENDNPPAYSFYDFADVKATESFGAVPEPTSGLLLLLGVAGLALRRKQK